VTEGRGGILKINTTSPFRGTPPLKGGD
jgi:hypothetical protein